MKDFSMRRVIAKLDVLMTVIGSTIVLMMVTEVVVRYIAVHMYFETLGYSDDQRRKFIIFWILIGSYFGYSCLRLTVVKVIPWNRMNWILAIVYAVIVFALTYR